MNNAGLSLVGKTVLITGASSGIGRCCAQTIARMGALLVLNGRDENRLQETLASLEGQGHRAVAADLSSAEGRDLLVSQMPATDGAVFAAGVHQLKPSKFINASSIEETFSINYVAPYLLSCALLKASKLNRGGSLVYIGSIAAEAATAGNGLYAGSKGALLSTARILALELARLAIRVNVVSPGQVQTAMVKKNAERLSAEALAQNEAAYPLGAGQPEDVANAVLFLLSPLSAWVTGHNLVVDGGYTLR